MLKKIFLAGGMVLLLSGCTIKLPFGAGGGSSSGSVFKSIDAGEEFEVKSVIDEKKTLTADILSAAMHPTNSDIIYVGTDGAGIYRTVTGGEEWQLLDFPPQKNYGLAVDQNNGDRLFASGVYNEVGKIYRTTDAGSEWKEIYTEPGAGTVITALMLNPADSQIVFAGTSAGVVIKSTDGGETWRNVAVAGGAVTQILMNKNTPGMVFLLVFNKGTMISQDGGMTFTDNDPTSVLTPMNGSQPEIAGVQPQSLFTLAGDTLRPGIFYAGAKNGLFRTEDYGQTWKALDIIESSKKFPIRSIAVNPRNSNEIVYTSGSAFYKSIDGGVKWSTAQLTITRGVSRVLYNESDPSILYFTLRAY